MSNKEFTNINGIKVCDQTARDSIPTKTSQLENDNDYATITQVNQAIDNAQLNGGGEVDLSSYAKITDLPTKTSQLTNDSGYITNIPDEYITETELNAKGYATTSQIPDVPTNVSEFTNDANYASETFVTNKIANAQLGGGEVDLSGYVTKETGNANQITFADGQTFQAKLNAGTLKGEKGDKGDAFTYDDFTPEQLASLKGDKGDTGEQGLQGIQGEKGDAFTYEDFTQEQLESLRGPQGEQGIQGEKGDTGEQGIQGEKGEPGTNGTNGQDGATFTPSVDTEGNLSWTNDKGLVNPTTVNIKGDTGANGNDGRDGLTTAISVNGTTYNHIDGTITIPNYPNVPTKTSELTNDSGFITSIPADRVVTTNISKKTLTLTTNKYQTTSMVSGTTIKLPSVTNYTEIHLFFTTGKTAPTITMPSGKYQKVPTINANTTYEFIFTYVNAAIGWLIGYIEYV